MNREQLKALGLTDEQIDAVMKEHGKTVNTTKEQLTALTTERDDLKTQMVDRDKQLETLSKAAGVTEELKTQIATLQTENTAAKEKYEKDSKELQLSTAIKLSLAGKVHDPDIVTSLIDKTKIELDESGNIKAGFEDQVKGLQTSKAFLFVPEDTGSNTFTFKGIKPPESGGTGGAGGSGNKAADLGKRVAEFSKQSNDNATARESYFGG